MHVIWDNRKQWICFRYFDFGLPSISNGYYPDPDIRLYLIFLAVHVIISSLLWAFFARVIFSFRFNLLSNYICFVLFSRSCNAAETAIKTGWFSSYPSSTTAQDASNVAAVGVFPFVSVASTFRVTILSFPPGILVQQRRNRGRLRRLQTMRLLDQAESNFRFSQRRPIAGQNSRPI